MWRDELVQGFWTSGRQQIAVGQHYQRLGTLSFIGMVSLVAVSWANKIPAVAATLVEAENHWRSHPLIVQMPDESASPDILPPANLPINQGGVVKVPPVNRPEAILPSTATSTTPPATVFPTNQIPTLSVPTLESPSAQTPIPLSTSKPLEGSFRRISPAINPVPVIEFGQPLPKIKPAKPVLKLQRFLPRL